MGQGEVHRRQFLKASAAAALSAALGEWGSDFARAAELAGDEDSHLK
jgi:hypothetical protein